MSGERSVRGGRESGLRRLVERERARGREGEREKVELEKRKTAEKV